MPSQRTGSEQQELSYTKTLQRKAEQLITDPRGFLTTSLDEGTINLLTYLLHLWSQYLAPGMLTLLKRSL